MKKTITITLIILCLFFNVRAQTSYSAGKLVDVQSLIDTTHNYSSSIESGKLIYKAVACYVIGYNNGLETTNRPKGNKVVIERDLFFKNYKISFYDEKGVEEQFNLSFLKDYGNGVYLMYDDFKNTFTVSDELKENGILNINHSDENDNVDFVVKITGAYKN